MHTDLSGEHIDDSDSKGFSLISFNGGPRCHPIDEEKGSCEAIYIIRQSTNRRKVSTVVSHLEIRNRQ